MHPSKQDRVQKLAAWKRRFEGEAFSVPRDRGALWSQIGGAAAAKKLALSLSPPLVTLEMTPLGQRLDTGDLHHAMINDFGAHWIAEKRQIFATVSRAFVKSLKGRVTVFLPDQLTRPRMGSEGSFAYQVKIIWDELKEADFGDPRIAAHRITSMRVCRVKDGKIVSDTFMGSSGYMQ